MARSVTLTTLIARSRRRADIENVLVRFPDVDLIDEINLSIQELVELIREAWGQDYFRATYNFTTTSGQSTYSLPADFLSLISVDVPISASMTMNARPYMESERNIFKASPYAWSLYAPIYYRLTASNINLIPTPNGSLSIALNYIPVTANLVNPSDTFDGIGGWEDYISLDVAIKCAIKDENYELISVLEGRKAAMRARIMAIATERDAGAPERVQDVVGYCGDDW